MITTFFLTGLITILNIVFNFFPVVYLYDLPLVGEGLYNLLITIVGTWNALFITFPYAETAWQIFINIIVPFEILLLIAKLFLGSRVPANLK